jgi:hypothetical protein
VILRVARPALTAALLFVIGASSSAAQMGRGPVYSIDAGTAALYDSNVTRRADGTGTPGIGGELVLRVTSAPVRPLFLLEYAPSFRASVERTPYDGAGHRLQLTSSIPVLSRLRADIVGRANRGGVDEDLNRADEIMLLARLDYDLDSDTRLRTYGAHRWRELGDGPAIGIYAGAELLREITSSTALFTEGRYEQLEPEDSTRLWHRYALSFGVEQAITRHITFDAEMRRRWRDYPYRYIDDDEPELGLREDRDWRAGGGIVYEFGLASQVRLDYEREWRDSTDPDRSYVAHRVGVAVRYRLFTHAPRTTAANDR